MNVTSEPGAAFLFRKVEVDDLHLRDALAVHLQDVRVFDLDDVGLRTACAIVRAGGAAPSVLIFEGAGRDEGDGARLTALRILPELSLLPFLVLGDGDDPEAEARAHVDGADGFLRMPRDVEDVERIVHEVEDFVARHGWMSA